MRESEIRRLDLLGEQEGQENEENKIEEQLPLEKNDFSAMWLSGMLVVGLPMLVIISIIILLVLLIFT